MEFAEDRRWTPSEDGTDGKDGVMRATAATS